ncbi:hypothetical protein [Streptomyces sp. NPDC053048]|uniref:hypothetical protein n=1 Tax=Streptomyces sp. NPDC053048 TaxID=3365694 RepID=UPI0037D44CF9
MRLSWPNLTWRKAKWPDGAYHATSSDGAWKYTLVHIGRQWRLSVKQGNDRAICATGNTTDELQRLADDHAAAHAT